MPRSAEAGSSDEDDERQSGVINIRNMGYVITRRHADLHKSKDAAMEANTVSKYVIRGFEFLFCFLFFVLIASLAE